MVSCSNCERPPDGFSCSDKLRYNRPCPDDHPCYCCSHCYSKLYFCHCGSGNIGEKVLGKKTIIILAHFDQMLMMIVIRKGEMALAVAEL